MKSDPRNGVLEWLDEHESVDGLEVIPNATSKVRGDRVSRGVLGLVCHPDKQLPNYLDAHKRGERSVPEYYSRFPEGRHATLVEGEGDSLPGSRYESASVGATAAEFAVRALNGKGRYPESEYTIHDCLPYPCIVEREGVGAIAVAPRVTDADDEGGGD